MVDIEQGSMARIKIRTDLGMDAAGTATLFAGLLVSTCHAVHIGRGSAQVGEIALEVGHLHHLPDFPENALLRTA